MKNFIFKSDADFHKILFNKLDLTLGVLREQRLQLDRIEYLTKKVLANHNLQKQVDEYFEDSKQREEDSEISESI